MPPLTRSSFPSAVGVLSGNEESHLHFLDDILVLDVVIYLACGCRHAKMGTVHFLNCGNRRRILFRTALVEGRIHPTSSLVFQDEEAQQNPIGHTLGMTSTVLAVAYFFLSKR